MQIGKLLPSPNNRKGFTLIELLVVIAIIAIISVVVVLVLNPSELLKQSRDSNRVADMTTLTSALGIYEAGGGTGFGNSNTVYVSIPDPTATSTAGDQCQGLGLPTLPSTYSYHCAATSTLRNVDSTGWIPINFGTVAIGSSLSQLPIDPINQSSSRLYYTYTTNGTQFETTAAMESAKYKLGGSNDVVSGDGSTLSTVYAKGSNLSLEPLDYGDSSLLGLWNFEEGSSSIAYDYSGNNATGSWQGTASGTSGYYSLGKIGNWAGQFNGVNTCVVLPSTPVVGNNPFTMSLWVKTLSTSGDIFDFGTTNANQGVVFRTDPSTHFHIDFYSSTGVTGSKVISDGNWHFLVATYNGNYYSIFVDGIADGTSSSTTGNVTAGAMNNLACRANAGQYLSGTIDDARVYNRALSAAEIVAMYAGGK